MGSPETDLWKDFLESKYSLWRITNLITPVRNEYKSRWWNDLYKVSLLDQGNKWFNSNMVWQVGFGENFKFWEDEWLANSQLKRDTPEYIITLCLKTNLLVVSEGGLVRSGSGHFVGEENGLSGKTYGGRFYDKYITTS